MVSFRFLVCTIPSYVIKPLQALRTGSLSIGRGKVDEQALVGGTEEPASLGQTLDNMRAELNSLYHYLEQQVAERTKELTVLYEISRVLSQSGDFEKKANRVMERLAQSTEAEWATLRVERNDEPGLHLIAAAGSAVTSTPPMPVLTFTETLAYEAVRSGELIVANDYPKEPNASPNIVALGMNSMVLIPFKAGDHTMGLVNIVSKKTNYFSPELIRLLTSVGEGLGALLENAQLDNQLKIQAELQRSEARAKALLESAPQGIIASCSAGEIVQVNDAALEIFGYSREELLGQPVDMLVPQELQPGDAAHRKSYFSDPETRRMGTSRELAGLRKDGSTVPLEIGLSSVPTESGAFVLAFISDISERKAAEEAERRWAEESTVLAEIGRTVSASLDINDVYESLGENIRKLIPFDRMSLNITDCENGTESPIWAIGIEVPGRGTGDQFPLAGALAGEVVRTRLPIFLEVETKADLEHRFPLTMSGYHVGLRSFMSVPLLDRDVVIGVLHIQSKDRGIYTHRHLNLLDRIGNQIAGAIANSKLFAEQRIAEERIRASLNEKDVLLKEVHHRVKNNLQVISSLLNLQSRNLDNDRCRDILKESRNRVRAMALIHEQLYQSDDLTRIPFGVYIRKLTGDLYRTYQVDSAQVTVTITAGSLLLSIDTAIPCGLIINELVSNSLKHAFPPGVPGEILIALEVDQERNFTLTVSDNGVGIPAGLDFRNAESLGMQLISSLVDQLGATVAINSSRGTRFTITFMQPKGKEELK